VQILLREVISAAGARQAGTAEYRDREIDVTEVTLGCAADCTLQIVGGDVHRHHATLKPAGAGFELRCADGATVLVEGAPVRRARLEPGAEFTLGNAHFRVAAAPPGFAAALAFTPATRIKPRAYEAAYETDLEQTRL